MLAVFGQQCCVRLRGDGIKAMSRGFSGGEQLIKFANVRNRGRFCSFYQTENDNGKL